jgi:hypothetical protein
MLPAIPEPQKLTAAITYLRRAQYLGVLGLVAEDDEDGNDAPEKKPTYENNPAGRAVANLPSNSSPTEQQSKAIYAISMKNGINPIPKFKTSKEAADWITQQNKK